MVEVCRGAQVQPSRAISDEQRQAVRLWLNQQRSQHSGKQRSERAPPKATDPMGEAAGTALSGRPDGGVEGVGGVPAAAPSAEGGLAGTTLAEGELVGISLAESGYGSDDNPPAEGDQLFGHPGASTSDGETAEASEPQPQPPKREQQS